MDKTTKALLLLTITLETIGWGLGMTGIIVTAIGWIFVGCGGVTFVILLLYLFKKPDKLKRPTSLEIKTLSFEIEKRIEDRKQYLPKLEEVIEQRLSALTPLIIKAGKLSLNKYRIKYLRYRNLKRDTQILKALRKFVTNNLYYSYLKESEENYKQIVQKYDILYSQIRDRKLKRLLNGLWKYEHEINSAQIFALISKGSYKVPNLQSGYKLGQIGQDWSKKALNNQLELVMFQMKELLDEGVEDE